MTNLSAAIDIPPRLGIVVAAITCLVVGGCRTPLDVSRIKPPSNVAESLAEKQQEDEEEQKKRTPIQAMDKFLARLHGVNDERPQITNNKGRDQYEDAYKLFEQEKYPEAEKEFGRLVKEFNHSTVREDALFMKAESQFQQEKYAKAQDNFEQLLEDYPSTRHMDQATRRLFFVAKLWLGEPEFATTSDIRQVDLEDVTSNKLPPRKKFPHSYPLVPNLTDRKRPVFDTPGRALEALKAVWLHDPTGPLADDALMLEATYHLRKNNFMEADRVFSILREEFPKSEHLQAAFVLGSHVKLMSYQGADYDGKVLGEAQQLKQSTLNLFPNAPEADRIRKELARMEEAKAQRDWSKVRFYKRKNNDDAVAVYCYEIIREYPKSSYAEMARQTLADLGISQNPLRAPVELPETQPKRKLTLWPQSDPKPADEKMADEPEPDPQPKPESDDSEKGSWFPKLRPPRLFPKRENEPPPRPLPIRSEPPGRVHL